MSTWSFTTFLLGALIAGSATAETHISAMSQCSISGTRVEGATVIALPYSVHATMSLEYTDETGVVTARVFSGWQPDPRSPVALSEGAAETLRLGTFEAATYHPTRPSLSFWMPLFTLNFQGVLPSDVIAWVRHLAGESSADLRILQIQKIDHSVDGAQGDDLALAGPWDLALRAGDFHEASELLATLVDSAGHEIRFRWICE